MPSRFERYRVKDGVTPLGERFLNPVFQDIDLRLSGLEALRLSWEESVRAVTDFGLARINAVLGPALVEVQSDAAEIETKRLAAVAALAQLESAIAGFEADAGADIAAWKAARIAELDAWRTSLTAELPGIDARLDALEVAVPTKADAGAVADSIAATQELLPLLAQPDDLGNFAMTDGAAAWHLATVDGYGLYRYDPASAETEDGEIIVAPASGNGRWRLVAPHWDFVWASLAGLLDDLQGQADAAMPASRVLSGSASLDFASIAAGATSALTIAVPGAAIADRVLLTPPDILPAGLVPTAWVSAADTVSVRLNNVTAAGIDPASMTYLVTVVKP